MLVLSCLYVEKHDNLADDLVIHYYICAASSRGVGVCGNLSKTDQERAWIQSSIGPTFPKILDQILYILTILPCFS